MSMKRTVLLFLVALLACCHGRTVVLITGCSSGIGKSAAEEFSKHAEFKVWATMRDTSKSLLPTDQTNLKLLSLDVSSESSIQQAVNQVLEEDGRIDILINNAGFGLAGCLETVTVKEAQDLFDVNLWGVVRTLQAVLPTMRKQRKGYIINISSTSGMRGIPCMEFYTASKFALEGLTDSMRYSLSAFNISVTNVNAGPVRTAFTDRFGDATVGGKGTRQLEDAGYPEYLHWYTNGMIQALNQRMKGSEAQDADELGHLLVKLALLKAQAKRTTDVPFNIGSNFDSQKIIEEVRKNPTGWGGIYSEILAHVPALPKPSKQRSEL